MKNRLWSLERPIRVGIAGAGDFGAEMVEQLSRVRNARVSVIGDLSVDAAKKAYIGAGVSPEDIAVADSAPSAQRLMEAGKSVVVEDARLMADTGIDCACDVTGSPLFGVSFAHACLTAGKHVVVVNIESDVICGSELAKVAARNGVVYTEADGDQPSLIAGMADWAETLGFTLTAAGKWTKIYPEEKWLTRGGRSNVGYSDGSKNQVEMCCVANMTGLVPDVRGMHKPTVLLTDIPRVFNLRENGGLFGSHGIVDVVNTLDESGRAAVPGHLGGGVFVVVRGGGAHFRETMRTKGVIHHMDGEYALIYRPFHLVGLEAPASILRAALYGEATGCFRETPTADVVAIAKRDIAAGETLTGIGGDMVRGEIVRAGDSVRGGCLPLGLAEGVRAIAAIPRGTDITYGMVESSDHIAWKLRAQMEQGLRAFA